MDLTNYHVRSERLASFGTEANKTYIVSNGEPLVCEMVTFPCDTESGTELGSYQVVESR